MRMNRCKQFDTIIVSNMVGHLNTVNSLITVDAEVNKADNYGDTPLFYASLLVA